MTTRSGKQGNEKTLARRIVLLDRLPPAGAPVTGYSVGELTEYLNANECVCGRRTVERDIESMTKEGSAWRRVGVHIMHSASPSDPRVKLWSHAPDSKALLLQALSTQDAVLLSLLQQELKFFLPASVHASLLRYMASSERVLALPGNVGHAQFRDRIRVIPDGPLRPTPEVDIAHLQVISEALMRGEQIDMAYWASSHKAEKDYRLHPVGLVKQGLFFWLLAIKEEKAHHGKLLDAVQRFRVDRIKSVGRRHQEVVARGLPTLAHALDSGALEFFQAGLIALRLRFKPGASGTELCNNYREAPLSDDQEVVACPDGGHELRATVRYSRQLLWMLQGQASLLRVLEPPALKQEMADFLTKAVAFHQPHDD